MVRHVSEPDYTLSDLKADIQNLRQVKGNPDIFTLDWKEGIEKDITDLDAKEDIQDHRISLLTNIIIKQDERIQFLEAKVNMLQQNEIKVNIGISGILEENEETRKSLFKKVTVFFKEVLEIQQEIPILDAFRLGQGNPRAVLVKLKFAPDKALIFSNANKLQGKKNSKKGTYYIDNNQTESQKELRMFYKDLQKENAQQNEDEKLTIKMQRGQLVVNNNMIKAAVTPPTNADILRMTDKQTEKARAYKLYSGPEHMEKGSEYFSFAFKAHNVQVAYDKIRVKYADATHISCAYRLENPIGPFRQQAIDDGDYGVGRSILKALKAKDFMNTGIFIVRYFGGVHLGKRRFDIVDFLTDRALSAMVTKIEQKRRRGLRQNSQTSISSAVSISSLTEEVNDPNGTEAQRDI